MHQTLLARLPPVLLAAIVGGCAQPVHVEIQEMSSKEVASAIATLKKSKDAAYIWDGTAKLVMTARVTDSATHRPISGATIEAVRVGGRNTEPFTSDDPTAMPPPQTTGGDGRAKLIAYFRAAGSADGSSVFVGDSFLRVNAAGYHGRRVRISPIVRLDFGPKTKHTEVTIPVALVHE